MREQIKSVVNSNRGLYLLKMRIQNFWIKYRKPIVGKNNVIHNRGFISNVKFDIVGNNNTIEIEDKALVSDVTIFIRGENHKLVIGANCIIKGGEFWFEDSFCEIVIGKLTTIERAHLAVTEMGSFILVGEDCMFSREIEIRTGDSHAIIDKLTDCKINAAQNVNIGNHVWIGARALILKGVQVGSNSIVGTGSIVTKDVPNDSIVAGVPAQVVRNNIGWVRDRFYPGSA